MISILTVTYGDRVPLLEKVIEAVKYQSISKMYIVCNGLSDFVLSKIKKITLNQNINISLVISKKNVGSAGGFKLGLQEIIKEKVSDYLLLLDDDNLISDDLVEKLNSLKIKEIVDSGDVISVLREDRISYKRISNRENPNFVLHPYNNFCGFNFFKKIQYFKINEKHGMLNIPYSPYGGLFFNIEILSYIGLPNEKLYLYGDDQEFTLRISKNRNIYLFSECTIKDIEQSWQNANIGRFSSFFKGDEIRRFYTFRNKFFIEREYLVKNNLIYLINKLLFIIQIILYSFYYANSLKSLALMKKAYRESKSISL